MKTLRKVLLILGVICGIITIVLGFKLAGMDCGYRQDTDTSFGGDFYTYSYRATARAANNVLAMTNILQSGFSYLLMAMGAFEILFFGGKGLKAFPKDGFPSAVESSESKPAATIENDELPKL